VAALVPSSEEVGNVGVEYARLPLLRPARGRLGEILVAVDDPGAYAEPAADVPELLRSAPARYRRRMSFHCRTRRSWRFWAASSIFRSWALGRLGMMGPEPKALSLLSSGSVPGIAARRSAGCLWSRKFSSSCARLCKRCHRSVTCTALGTPFANASR